MSTHRDLREQLGVYALGHGTPAERTAVRAHLDGCASCRAELADLAPLRDRLAAVDPARVDDLPGPPAHLGDRVLAGIAAERATVPVPLHRRRWAAAVAAAGIAAAGFGVGWLVRPVPEPPPLEPVAVQVAVPEVQATADVVPHTWGMEVQLHGAGFAAGEVYRAQVTEDDGRVVSAGEFIGTGPAEMVCNLNSSVLRADAASFEVLDSSGAVVLTSSL
ncbi:Putative zinc-finger [Klenkia marina]|uniref:Putative zinc-finger n=1 Tax=Klenkia marina TaxID=1960309 RepID=A0A1G4YQ51_9ACTN|nr:zf-HC2 domain-containing protein [Klenkia marina]SCX55485.1 Putative zinc-finger [Klenkia marina]